MPGRCHPSSELSDGVGHGLICHLALQPHDCHHHGVDAAFDDRDVTSILSGVFDMKASLSQIANDIKAIRLLLEDEDEEEEEEEDAGEGPSA